MNRRHALALLAATTAEAQESIYIPERHTEKDKAFIEDFLLNFPFAMVITTAGGLHITNVPTVFTKSPANWGKLWFHIAAANAQNQPLTEGPATIVFHGPHTYISPNWYETKSNVVPTWNFAVVHCTGRPTRIKDDEALARGLRTLVEQNEARYGGGDWKFANLPETYLKNMRHGIVGYEMEIDKVEAKFKLGQERPEVDRQAVLKALRSGKGAEKSIAQLTAEYYNRAR